MLKNPYRSADQWLTGIVSKSETPLESFDTEYPSESEIKPKGLGSRLDSKLRPSRNLRIGSHYIGDQPKELGSTPAYEFGFLLQRQWLAPWMATWWGNYGFQLSAKWRYQSRRVFQKSPLRAVFCANCWAFAPFTKAYIVLYAEAIRFGCALQCLWWLEKCVFLAFFPIDEMNVPLNDFVVGQCSELTEENPNTSDLVKGRPILWILLAIIHFYLAKSQALFFIVAGDIRDLLNRLSGSKWMSKTLLIQPS